MSVNALRVYHLGKYYPPAPGGIETHVRTLAQSQAELGASVRVLCVNHERGPTVIEHDGPVEVTRIGRVGSAAKIDVCPGLIAALRHIDADILHLQTPNPTMVLALLAARPKAPLVVTYQSDVINKPLREAIFRPFERRLYRRVEMILPTSPSYAEGSVFLRSYADKLHVLPMGIDLKPYLEPTEADRAEAAKIRDDHAQRGPLWFGAGRLVYYKGFLNAVRALTKVEGRLILVGDGPEGPALRDEAKRLGVLDRVVFAGTLPYLRLIPYYLAADAFWFPSNFRSEAFGLVQVEAMASGCPVINTLIHVSGVSWVSRDGETGLTVPINDPEALAAAARRIVTEAGLREKLVAGGKRRAVAEFDQRVMARRSLDIYSGILAGKGRGVERQGLRDGVTAVTSRTANSATAAIELK